MNSSCRITALSIAGSDSGGGAGIQADLKTFAALGVWGTSVLTASTAQNTEGVFDFYPVSVSHLRAQFMAVKDGFHPAAIKTGMLYSTEILEAAAHLLGRPPMPLVVDPVMIATSGASLLADDAIEAYRRRLIPLASIVTPNLAEASRLLDGRTIDSIAAMRSAAADLMELGCRSVLLKGGHLPGPQSPDIFYDGTAFYELDAPRIDTPHTHGTGCTLSAALAAYLALDNPLELAARKAKDYVQGAIAAAGPGGLEHFWQLKRG